MALSPISKVPILLLCLLFVSCGPLPTPIGPTSTPIPTETPASPISLVTPSETSTTTIVIPPAIAVTPTVTPPTGKQVGNVESFSIIDNYDPSGHLGDIGDIITVANLTGSIQYTYETRGAGTHEWDWKYVYCDLNPEPAKFSGTILLDPPGNFGIIETGGYDLRGFKTIKWDARSSSGDVYVEFFIGGVVWEWKLDGVTNCWKKESVPYPDSLPRISLGTKLLTSQSHSFEYDLSAIPEDYLRKVISGFGWTITWGGSDVVLDEAATPPGPVQPKTIIIEVSDIRYER